MSTLERAIAISVEAHAGQKDKADAPYILHPLRVMMALETCEEQIAGVMHDVVEDSNDWSLDRLRDEGFSEVVLETLDSVTKREGESYEQFVWRAGKHPIGIRVKLADLHDNADLGRFEHPSDEDRKRAARYERSIRELESRLAIGEARFCARVVQDGAIFIESELPNNQPGDRLRHRILAACGALRHAANEIMLATVEMELSELHGWVESGDSAAQTSQRLETILEPLESEMYTLHQIVLDLRGEAESDRAAASADLLVGGSAKDILYAFVRARETIRWLAAKAAGDLPGGPEAH